MDGLRPAGKTFTVPPTWPVVAKVAPGVSAAGLLLSQRRTNSLESGPIGMRAPLLARLCAGVHGELSRYAWLD